MKMKTEDESEKKKESLRSKLLSSLLQKAEFVYWSVDAFVCACFKQIYPSLLHSFNYPVVQ